jgi:hypothetical protein
VREHFADKVCRQVIPRTVRLSEAPSFGQPITSFDPMSRGAIAYRELAKEILGLENANSDEPDPAETDPVQADDVQADPVQGDAAISEEAGSHEPASSDDASGGHGPADHERVEEVTHGEA